MLTLNSTGQRLDPAIVMGTSDNAKTEFKKFILAVLFKCVTWNVFEVSSNQD